MFASRVFSGDNYYMTNVEQKIRSQHDAWRDIAGRMACAAGALPMQLPQRILFFGVGSSQVAARLSAFAVGAARGGRAPKRALGCNSTAIGRDVVPGRGDWAVAFSHRGGNYTEKALRICKQAGAFTIWVCGRDAAYPDPADMAVETVVLETVEPHTAAVSGAICAATSLLAGAEAMEAWERLAGAPDPEFEKIKAVAGSGPSVIVGEWEAEWLAREGALKLMEMAAVKARAFGSEEYCHGPQLAAAPEDRIWHVVMPGDPRAGAMNAAHEIKISGCGILDWLPALVELQWLALAVAHNTDKDPDRKK